MKIVSVPPKKNGFNFNILFLTLLFLTLLIKATLLSSILTATTFVIYATNLEPSEKWQWNKNGFEANSFEEMQMYDRILQLLKIDILDRSVPNNCNGIMLSCKMCQYYRLTLARILLAND